MRLAVYIPKGETYSYKFFERYTENEKKYLKLHLDKYALDGISADPNNSPDDNKKIRSLLKDYNYDLDL